MGDLFLPWYGYLAVCAALYLAKWYFDPVREDMSLAVDQPELGLLTKYTLYARSCALS